jgi:hypothetical protein
VLQPGLGQGFWDQPLVAPFSTILESIGIEPADCLSEIPDFNTGYDPSNPYKEERSADRGMANVYVHVSESDTKGTEFKSGYYKSRRAPKEGAAVLNLREPW